MNMICMKNINLNFKFYYNNMRKNLKIWREDLCNISDDAEIGEDCVIHSGVTIFDDVIIENRDY